MSNLHAASSYKKKPRQTKLQKIQSLVNAVYGQGFTAHLYKGAVYVERDSDQYYKILHSQDFAIEILTELKNRIMQTIISESTYEAFMVMACGEIASYEEFNQNINRAVEQNGGDMADANAIAIDAISSFIGNTLAEYIEKNAVATNGESLYFKLKTPSVDGFDMTEEVVAIDKELEQAGIVAVITYEDQYGNMDFGTARFQFKTYKLS